MPVGIGRMRFLQGGRLHFYPCSARTISAAHAVSMRTRDEARSWSATVI
jgi:hypothetical protein